MSYTDRFQAPHSLPLASVVEFFQELGVALQEDQLPSSALAQMHLFYDRLYAAKNHFLHHFAPFVCEADKVFRVPESTPHLLDLGCGVGTQSYLLAARGAKITGIDAMSERVAAGQAMAEWFAGQFQVPLDVQLHAGDAFEFLEGVPEGHYDGVFTQFALAYMKPYRRMLKLLDRALKPGGRVLFREFNAGGIYNRLVSRLDRLTDRQFKAEGEQLGWRLVTREFCWLIPKPIVNISPPDGGWARLDDQLAKTVLARHFASSMTVVFEKH